MNVQLPEKNINVSVLPKAGKTLCIIAEKDELTAATSLLEADELLFFTADVTFKPWKTNGAVLSGSVEAKISQTCATTLKRLENRLQFDFRRYFLPKADPVFANDLIIDGELILDPKADDPPDIIDGRSVDLWPVLIEELNLQIDPYPRTEMFDWQDTYEKTAVSDTHKPFAGLKTLITKKNTRAD